jgi:hypothetical protein
MKPEEKVLRGCSCYGLPEMVRLAESNEGNPNECSHTVGFRIVKTKSNEKTEQTPVLQ